jgi:hypothetical protein
MRMSGLADGKRIEFRKSKVATTVLSCSHFILWCATRYCCNIFDWQFVGKVEKHHTK